MRTVEVLRSLGHEVVERDLELPRSTFTDILARYLRGIHDDVGTLPLPERLERRTRTMARMGGVDPGLDGRQRASGRRPPLERPGQRAAARLRRAAAARPRRPTVPIGQYEGRSARVDAERRRGAGPVPRAAGTPPATRR